MRVLVTSKSFGHAAPEALDLLAANGIEVVRGSRPSLSAAEIAAEIPGFDALVVGNDPVDAGVLAAGDRLRLVHMHGTGLDAIDIPAATARGVLVANAPGANRNAVAELTVALMLVAARSIDRHIDILRSGRWERTPGHEISGKTVGILGLGQIGRRIVELLSGFGVRTVAFDVAPDRDWAARNGVTLAAGADEVCAEADFVVLALSLNAQTRSFIGARRLGLMKRGSYLINTARGGLVDEAALCAALRDKAIAGAAIDVFDPEPLPPDSPLRHSGATLTPHLAATSVESAGNVSRIVARNVVDVLLHGRAACAVNPQALARRLEET
ncbi:phosphoglycerate dehydrogenase [Propionivibrio sp.]|uniref:phosphoglycerate dehydrogenase n=1 Tax=Propionivibrio sp. TaxID=2212460 RepID=UPI0039E6A12E